MNILSKIMSFVLIIPALFGLYVNDNNDTESLYFENVSAVGYENTIESAIPQTTLYRVIKSHFESGLPGGTTEKKAILISFSFLLVIKSIVSFTSMCCCDS